MGILEDKKLITNTVSRRVAGDSSIRNLDLISKLEIEQFIDTLILAVDSEDITEAQGLRLIDILRSTAMTVFDETNKHEIVTPKSFFETLMGYSSDFKGIGYKATLVELLTKVSGGILAVEHVDTLFSMFKEEFFYTNSSAAAVKAYNITSRDANVPSAMNFTSAMRGDLIGGAGYVLTPPIAAGIYIDAALVQGSIQSDQKSVVFGTTFPRSGLGSNYTRVLDNSFNLTITSDRRELKISSAAGDQTNCRIAISVNLTTRI